MPFCRSCGKELSAQMVFCSNCGRRVVIPKDKQVENGEADYIPTPELEAQEDRSSSDDLRRNTSGQGALAVIPTEIKAEIVGWNWGAFLLWWIWGIGNNTYISFLTLIPYFGQIVMPFVLGAKGNEWAWRNKRWESIEHFRRVQYKWATAGIVAGIISLGIFSAIIISSV